MADSRNAVELPAVVRLQVVLVRSLLDCAVSASREGDDVGLMTAMLLADVAVETLTKAPLFDKKVDFGRQDKLAKLLDELEKRAR